jgi:hydrophobic/amphiphilic exporter-1 (mainly G- bacteria), HAE1 family
MFVNFFIKRPVFATVCSILIILVGMISLPTLPVEYYPDVTPPSVEVRSNYPGASAETVETNVTTILEQQLNGVEGLNYIDSTSDSSGGSQIRLTFTQGYDKNIAAVDVQNRIAVVQSQLPQEVLQTGVTVSKVSTSIINVFGLYSENDRYDPLFVSNYASLYLVDALKRVPGVGDVTVFGQRTFAMRIWLDPSRLASRGLTPMDVSQALRDQNIQVGAGVIGAPPTPPSQEFQMGIQAVSRLANAEEFGQLVVQRGDDGSLIRLNDVGRVELGAQDYVSESRFLGQKAVGLGIYLLPGANAINVARATEETMKELSQQFPPGLKYELAFDTTEAVNAAVEEVVMTLLEAVGMVIAVMFIFLQDWRTTLIPTLTIPVSLIGTFAFIKAFGFSINSLTLFGVVLATGLVVDDAIVVVENIIRLMEEKALSAREAAFESMAEVTGAVIATSLVLMAVFIPVVFFPGVTGRLYQQFALTIVFSVAISTFNALTLTPALAALLLRQGQMPQNWFFNGINWAINKTRRGYATSLTWVMRFKAATLAVFAFLIAITYWIFTIVPSAFVPEEDQGYFVTLIQSPQGVSLDYTDRIVTQVEQELRNLPGRRATFAISGFSFFGNGPDKGIVFTSLTPWDKRPPVQALIGQAMGKFSQITDALVFSANVPTINLGGGGLGGFEVQIQDEGNVGLDNLAGAVGQLVGKANATPGFMRVSTPFAINAPQLKVEVDRSRALALGVNLQDIFNTLQIYLGSAYVNNFNLFARSYRVIVQADRQFRANPDDLGKLYVRSQTNQMIPLANLIKITQTVAPPSITHHNLFRSAQVTGGTLPFISSGQAIATLENLIRTTLPRGISHAWTGLSLEELKSGGLAPLIFGLGLVFAFLVLAAQYESYIDPIIIILSVPLAVLGALLAQLLRGLPNDVFCQIGLVMLIGLASKNAILIVEFANQNRDSGMSNRQAAISASEERLRPILMTALSFIFGTLPLVFATGSGAAARQSLGTAIYGGMIASTFLSLYIVPVIFVVINNLYTQLTPKRHRPSTPAITATSASETDIQESLQTDSESSESSEVEIGQK